MKIWKSFLLYYQGLDVREIPSNLQIVMFLRQYPIRRHRLPIWQMSENGCCVSDTQKQKAAGDMPV
jgi:hypothetical protein